MTNNSGKFISTVSNKEPEMTMDAMTKAIPPAPGSSILQYVEEYFGRYWWLWIILLILILKTK